MQGKWIMEIIIFNLNITDGSDRICCNREQPTLTVNCVPQRDSPHGMVGVHISTEKREIGKKGSPARRTLGVMVFVRLSSCYHGVIPNVFLVVGHLRYVVLRLPEHTTPCETRFGVPAEVLLQTSLLCPYIPSLYRPSVYASCRHL